MILKFLIKKILSEYIMIKGHQAFILKYIFFNNKKYESKKCNISKDNILSKNNQDFLDDIVFLDLLYF